MKKGVARKLRRARVARLATTDRRGRPHVVPVCFAYDGRAFYTAVDLKPKRAAPEKLTRVRNILANPNVALLVDDYREDWSRLWFILVRGNARLLRRGKEQRKAHRLLRKKYRQYAAGLLPAGAPVIRIRPTRILSWGKL
ncbi:MAG: TIGR03668 family PPOX class F420-dependent oxidoreductase [Candidatus Acidoferrales bacterium]